VAFEYLLSIKMLSLIPLWLWTIISVIVGYLFYTRIFLVYSKIWYYQG
jgi:hypothetical protein